METEDTLSSIWDQHLASEFAAKSPEQALATMTAEPYVNKGAEVVVVGRTFRDDDIERLRFISADLPQMKQARRVAEELPVETLDTLILTMGTGAGKQREVSPEGIELDLAVSYLSRFVIVRDVAKRVGVKRLEQIAKPRIFVMGGPGVGIEGDPSDLNSERKYEFWHSHGNTIAGNEALVIGAASRYPGVNFYGLNPGAVKSNIRSHFLGAGSFKHRLVEGLIGMLFGGPDEYAENIAPLIVSPDIEHCSGAMFNKRGEAILPSPAMGGGAYVRRFMEASERLARTVWPGIELVG